MAANPKDVPEAVRIGYASHRLDTGLAPVQEYSRKARVSWDHPCQLPNPVRGKDRVGVWTGARRAPYPPIFRPAGNNTRQHVLGNRSKITGMTSLGYHADIVESKPVPPLIPPGSMLAQEGSPEVLRHVPSLRSGPHHYLIQATRG